MIKTESIENEEYKCDKCGVESKYPLIFVYRDKNDKFVFKENVGKDDWIRMVKEGIDICESCLKYKIGYEKCKECNRYVKTDLIKEVHTGIGVHSDSYCETYFLRKDKFEMCVNCRNEIKKELIEILKEY